MSQAKNEYLPLTQMQRGIFVDSSAAAGDDPYIMQVMIDFAQPLDREQFSRAVDTVAAAHPAVRACFRTRASGEPVQVVVPAVHVPNTRDDLRDIEPELVAERLEQIRQDDSATAFDLSVPPLMRFCIVDLPGGRQHLLFSCHHIVLDGWSVPPFLGELLAVYRGADPVAEFVFRDYLAWESQADPDAARQAFSGVLDGFGSPSMIAEHVVDCEPGERTIVAGLRTAETAALAGWCRRREISMASVVEACWGQTVALQTGRTDVVVGVMEANRSLGTPGIATAIGLFANVVPVRVDLTGEIAVAEVCGNLARQRLETLPHRHFGLGRIQAMHGGAPLFDTIITFQNYRSTDASGNGTAGSGPGVRILNARSHAPTTQPAMLAVIPGDALRMELTYRTQAVSASRAQAMLDVFTHLLGSVPVCADVAVRDWPLVPADGSAKAAGENELPATRAWDILLPGQLVEAARRHPGRPALSTETGITSYGELFDQAAAMAGWLAEEHGVGPGVAVAVAVEDDLSTVTTRLAVLLAGAALYALGPGPTADALECAPGQADVGLVLADRARAPHGQQVEIVLIDDPAVHQGIRRHLGCPIGAGPAADTDQALTTIDQDRSVRHTITHRALADTVVGYADRIGLSSEDTLLTPSAESMMVLAALVRGAHVVLGANPAGETRRWPADRDQVTVLEGTGAALGHAARVDPGAFAGRRVIVNRPPLTRSVADAIREAGAQLWLAYAPGGELASLTPVCDSRSAPAIGAAQPGIQLQVLDPHGRIVPDGSLGEIVVAAGGLRRTGHLGRRSPSGAIDYLGSVQQRLEIRGNRIEPWLIEEALTTISGVAEAAVYRVDNGNSPALVAHVAPASVDVDAVTEALRGRLPGYAVPARMATWPQLPRIPTGDVDMDKLTDRLDDGAAGTADVARLAALFAEVTGAEDVGPHSDFFALGGDSIGITRLRARAAAQHGWELDVRLILDRRTPAAIAPALAVDRAPFAVDTSRSSLSLADHDDRLPRRAAESGRQGALVGTQASLWLLNQLDPESSGYNLTLALDLDGDLDEAALAAAVDDVAQRHEILRTRYLLQDGVPVQLVDPLRPDRPLLTIADTPAEVLDRVLATSAARGFRLGEELPMRAELHRVDARRASLLLTFHHVAMDGASFLPFARDLELAFRARSHGHAPRFSASPVQYLDYAGWLARRLGEPEKPGSMAARQASYWKEHLAGLADSTGIPVKAARPGDGIHAGRLIFAWGTDVRDAVGQIAGQAGCTRFAVYQTALAAVMHSLGAPTELALGAPVSVRPHVDLDDAIGNYSNFVVSRVQLDLAESMRWNSARRGRALAAELDHQDLPFNEVVRAVNAQRQPGRNPLYQTVLALQSFDKPTAHLEGVAVSERLMPVVDARIDVVVALVEGAPGEGVTVSAEFAESAYRPATVELLAERFRLLLLNAAVASDLAISSQLRALGSGTSVAPDGPSAGSETAVDLAPVGAPAPEAVSTVSVADALLTEVVAAYRKAIRFSEVDPDVGYFDAGGDSVGTVSVAAALARHQVDIATLMTGPSARELAARIATGEFGTSAGSPGADFAGVAAAGYDVSMLEPFSTILPIRPVGTGRPLFVFHGGVGLSIPYTGLSRVIDSEIPIYGLQSTESIFGATPPDSMTEQVRQYLAAIRLVQPHGPYRLLGWSYGGWAAHEAARLIEQEGDEVDLLVIIDSEVTVDPERSWGPELPREAVVRAFTRVLGIAAQDGSDVTTAEQLYLAFQRMDGAFAQLSPNEVNRFVDVMQNHARLARGHRPGIVRAPTILFWSSSIGTRHPGELSDDWAPFLAGPVSSISLEAQHQFLMHPLPQRLIGTAVNTLMQDPGRAQLLAEPRYREELDLADYLPDLPDGAQTQPDAEPRVGEAHPPQDDTTSEKPSRLGGRAVETGTLIWRRLHHLRKTPWRLISVALNPLILILAFGYLFANAIVIPGYDGVYMSYLLAGVSAQAALQNIGPTAVAIRADLDKGLFDRFRSLPMGRGVVLLAHSVADSIIGVLGMLIVVLGGYLAGWRLGTDLAGFAFGLLVLILFTYTWVWVGIGVGLFVKNLESIESIAVTLTLGLSFLSNALLAPGTLPGWLQPFAEWNPVSAIATAVRQAWGNPSAESASIAGDFPLLVACVFCAVILLVVPLVAQRRYGKSR